MSIITLQNAYLDSFLKRSRKLGIPIFPCALFGGVEGTEGFEDVEKPVLVFRFSMLVRARHCSNTVARRLAFQQFRDQAIRSLSQGSDPLPRCQANYEALTPISFVQRAATVFPQRTAVVQLTEDEERIFTWAESFGRCKRLASALSRHGVGKGDVVAVMLPNVPEMFESHNGVPMCGGILNSINTRLDAPTIAYILEHSGAKVTGLPLLTVLHCFSVIIISLCACMLNFT